MEDLCDGIPEIKDTVKQCRAVAVFVKSHGRVKAAFKRIIGSKGTMLVLFPDTRFGYADKTVERVCKNQENLASLVDGAGWRTLLSNADGQQTTNFVATVNDVFFFKKSKLLRKLTGPLSALVHHLERGEARASNVYPLYSALEKHAVAWAADSEIVRYFSQETRENVVLKIQRRWRGDLPLRIGLKCPEYFVAWLLDPCTTPCASELPDDWEELLRAV